MKTNVLLLALALGASTCLLTAQDSTQRPEGQRPPGREGGPGMIHLLPPRAQEALKLTEEQKKQIAALEAETKAKLEKILTPEQLVQLKNTRPPGGQGGPGGEPGNPGAGKRSARPAGEQVSAIHRRRVHSSPLFLLRHSEMFASSPSLKVAAPKMGA